MTDPSRATPPPPPPPSGAPPGSSQAYPPGPTATTPAAASPKKKIPPLAWVAMGCGCLVILAAASTLLIGGWFVHKAGETISDIADNPVMATAERVVEMNPDLELVSSDREKERLEIRDKKSGKTYWVDASQIRDGQISFGEGDQMSTLKFRGEGGQGSVELEGPEGTSRLHVGSGAGGKIPDWLPVPEGAETGEGVFSFDTPESQGGTITLTTDQTVDEVVAFYRRAFEDKGWKVSRATYSGDMGEGATLSTTSPDGKRTVVVGVAAKDGRTQIGIYHTGEASED